MLVQTLKGFRDFLPEQARKRQYVINTLKDVFSSYGFEPLETPALEYEEILTGKYGDEGDKLMYRFEDNGGRRVALRYDQTVPLARVVAQYQNELPTPFKRYQIQPVWRAENTQRGRFREFLQCDIDITGLASALADAEILAIIADSYSVLGFKNFKILINDRTLFSKMPSIKEKELPIVIRAIDKIKKIGREKVLEEIIANGISPERATAFLQTIESQKPTAMIQDILTATKQLGIPEEKIEFIPTLARGLDYYTGIIIEVEIDGYSVGSVGGGGRYDNLIGMFAGKQIPAVGFAFGFDRIIEALEEQKLFPTDLSNTKVLVTIFSPDLLNQAIEASYQLRASDITTELYLDPNAKMEKQLKYADQKNIPYVIIIGSDEAEKNLLTIKNLKTREQKKATLDEVIKELQG